MDHRWIHRAKKRWDMRRFDNPSTLEWRFFDTMMRLIRLRKAIPAFHNGGMQVIDTGNPHLFGFVRRSADQRVVVVNNFSPHPQAITAERLSACGCSGNAVDLVTGTTGPQDTERLLGPYGFVWLDCSPAKAGTGSPVADGHFEPDPFSTTRP
jgi:amylosucrase